MRAGRVDHKVRKGKGGLVARLAKDIAPAANGGTANKDVLRYSLKVEVLAKAAHCNGSNGGRDVGRLKELTAEVVTTAGHLLFRHRGPVGGIAREVTRHYTPPQMTVMCTNDFFGET